MVVNFVRKHWAQPGVTVTESKFLYDAQSQIEREVDIVIEGTFDGEPSVTSVEVIEHGRLPPSSGLNSRLISIATFQLID
jgi:hypothetical protein